MGDRRKGRGRGQNKVYTMKRYTPFLLLLAVLALSILPALPADAQDGIILQVTAPFFAEDILQPVIDEY